MRLEINLIIYKFIAWKIFSYWTISIHYTHIFCHSYPPTLLLFATPTLYSYSIYTYVILFHVRRSLFFCARGKSELIKHVSFIMYVIITGCSYNWRQDRFDVCKNGLTDKIMFRGRFAINITITNWIRKCFQTGFRIRSDIDGLIRIEPLRKNRIRIWIHTPLSSKFSIYFMMNFNKKLLPLSFFDGPQFLSFLLIIFIAPSSLFLDPDPEKF